MSRLLLLWSLAVPLLVAADPLPELRGGGFTAVVRADGAVAISDGAGRSAAAWASLSERRDGSWRSLRDGGPRTVERLAAGVAVGAILPDPAGEAVTATWRIETLPAGGLALELRLDPAAVAGRRFSAAALSLRLPRATQGAGLRIDGRALPLPVPGRDAARLVAEPFAETTLFAADKQPWTCRVGAGAGLIDRLPAADAPRIELVVPVRDGLARIELLSPQAPAPGLLAQAGLDLPDRRGARNLVVNPGFEQELHGWQFDTHGRMTANRLGEHYRAVEGGAWRGSRCLEIRGEAGQSPAGLATLAIPVEPGRPYVLSFHARTDVPGTRLQVGSTTGEWPRFPVKAAVAPGAAWGRHQLAFTAPDAVVSLSFAVPAPADDATVWIDGVQLEAGDQAGPYQEPSLAARLATARRGNLLVPGEPAAAVLHVAGPAGAAVQVRLEARPFPAGAAVVVQGAVTLDGQGAGALPLPAVDVLGQGLWVVDAVLATADGPEVRDVFRLATLPVLAGAHRHRALFGAGRLDQRSDGWERRAALLRQLGVGAVVTRLFDPPPQEWQRLFTAAGIEVVASVLDHGERLPGSGEDLRRGGLPADPAVVRLLAGAVTERVAANPLIRAWKTVNEPELPPLLAGGEGPARLAALVALQRELAGAIRAADPRARVLCPDPANLYPGGGLSFIDAYLAAGGARWCDVVAVHPYRPRPEDPDLDAHTAALLALLDRHGFAGEVWFSEGIYHQNWHVPALRLDVHQACTTDHYRAGTLGYGLGTGERLCAAYSARHWLGALKHARRVRQYIDWGLPDNVVLDADFTPTASAAALATVARLLGDAEHLADIDLGELVHCRLFRDPAGRTLAALWSSDPEVDGGRRPGPLLEVDGWPGDCRAVDLAGREANCQARRLELGSCPRFLVSGQGEALAAALGGGRFPAGGVAQTRTWVKVVDAGRVEVGLANLLSQPQRGAMRIESPAGPAVEAVALEPRAERRWAVPVAVAPGVLQPLALAAGFAPAGQEPAAVRVDLEVMRWKRLAAPPRIDGTLDGWDAAHEVVLPQRLVEFPPRDQDERARYPLPPPWGGPADLAVRLWAGWDDQALYLAVEVADDRHDPVDVPGRDWTGDSLQLYLDAWGDGRERRQRGYANDDQALRLWQRADGAMGVLRETAPEQQVAFLRTGPVAGATAAMVRADGRTRYELRLPRTEIQPLRLAEGSVFGFALLVNDRDGDYRKRALTLTPAGTEPRMRPDLYPVVVLEP